MKDVQIAVAIFRSPVNQVRKTIDRMAGLVEKAKREGAEIICFPEMGVTGYSIRKEIRKAAQPLSGSISKDLKRLAKQWNMVILAGMAEKGNINRIHASHLMVPPKGQIGVYRKLHIAPPEQGLFSAGSRIPVFDAAGIRFGIQLCYDAHFPDLATQMALKGAEILFIPHASPRGTPSQKLDSWMRHLPARAYDNSLFVVACNQVGENGEGLAFPGIAMAIGPDGRTIKKKTGNTDTLLVVNLRGRDLLKIRDNRMAFFLPNRRPDLYGSG